MNHITATLIAAGYPFPDSPARWIVDGLYRNTDEDKVSAMARACCSDNGTGPEAVALEIFDGDEAFALYKARVATCREMDLIIASNRLVARFAAVTAPPAMMMAAE